MNSPPQSPSHSMTDEQGQLPTAHLQQLQLLQHMIDAIQSGVLEDDIQDEILLDQIWNPSPHIEFVDSLSKLSNDLIIAMSSCGS